MIKIVAPFINKLGIVGITLFPFIVFDSKKSLDDVYIVNHEEIHIRQQIELLIIFFYLIYLIEYGLGLLKFKNKNDAYRNISFENEAYSNENNLNYLKTRKLYSFFKYFNKK
jgi:hypothetical protein